ncbi:hypothetical protein EWW49_04900 [Pseudomonas syringae]|nr:hypothetical protein D5S12_19410 [Pseudomonas syringae]TFZ38617.1 hypothetical protein EWW49_04900 [Pseudomonas syringae]
MTSVPMLHVGMQFWTLCVLFVALRVTQGWSIQTRLKPPFFAPKASTQSPSQWLRSAPDHPAWSCWRSWR